ncbi:MAG: DUF3304 domain-containing protein [Proteobacteria bacterium]|nr:MAG: DUF3304 domain-containing protein [Pseudomonadota bacterium]
MKISALSFLKPNLISSLLSTSILLGMCTGSHSIAGETSTFPASLRGVHHLGSEYFINRFFIDQSIGDNIGEGGGGGSIVCCVTLPRQWRPSISVDVRWKVHHIIRKNDPKSPDTAELEGIYHAQVPVEKYIKPGDFFVHFFPKGRVRVLVSNVASNSEEHPIRKGDTKAIQTATQGETVKALFTDQELAQHLKIIEDERKKYGDWR